MFKHRDGHGEHFLGTVGIILFFICTYPYFLTDSVQYFSYIDFFEGIRPLSEWNPDRGFVYPFLLWLGTIIAPGGLGLMVIFTICYLIFLIYIYKLITLVLRSLKYEICDRAIRWFIIILFCINPVIYSCSHVVLTEFFSAVLLMIQFYYATLFFIERTQDKQGPKRIIWYTILVSILIVLEYFLKQMYFPISVVIVVMYEILYVIRRYSLKNMMASLGICLVMMLSLVASVKVFSSVTDQSAQTDSFAIVMGGLRYFEVEGAEHKDGDIRISHYYVGTKKVRIMDDMENVIDEFDYEFTGTFGNSLNFIFTCLKQNPERVIQGYWDNYMLLCGFYQRPWENGVISYQTGRVIRGNIFINLFDLDEEAPQNLTQEIRNSFLVYLLNGNVNTGQLMETYSTLGWSFWNQRVLNYRDVGGSLVGRFVGLSFIFNGAMLLWSVLIFFSPIFGIYSFVRYCRNRKEISSLYYAAQCVLNIFAVSQILFFSLTGCVVDRYMFAAYVTQLSGLMLMLIVRLNRETCTKILSRIKKLQKMIVGNRNELKEKKHAV